MILQDETNSVCPSVVAVCAVRAGTTWWAFARVVTKIGFYLDVIFNRLLSAVTICPMRPWAA